VLGSSGYILSSECQMSFAPPYIYIYIYLFYVLFYDVSVSRTIRIGLNGGINRE